MKNMKYAIIILIVLIIGCKQNNKEIEKFNFSIVDNKTEQKVDINIDGKLFTSYIYTDKISNLKKTVLFPIIASNGKAITRGFPLAPRPNERVDHPHHIGAWLNYGDVNGLDYWGFSDSTPKENLDKMGTIRHDKIIAYEANDGEAEISTSAKWLKPNGEILLKEKTIYNFYASENIRIIDRTLTLTAIEEDVLFNDTKEGMMAIRVARELEHPSDKPVTLSDVHGQKTDVPVLDNTGVTGNYLSSEGIEGLDTWGKRAKWVALSGTIENEDVTVVIMDTPDNLGYPTYWHARGYGLFAANPFGHRAFTKGKEELNFTLKANSSITLKYRILVMDGKQKKEIIEEEYNKYIKGNL